MKFLRKFKTMASYNEAKSNLILPNVSLITETNGVAYKPLTSNHDYVEIHGIKWATMNVGANSITDTGLYFQWGDTQGYMVSQVGSDEGEKFFGWPDYKYSDSDIASDAGTIAKYNESDGLTTLQSSDDAVTAAWGGTWRTPTTAEFAALGAAVNSAWTADYQGSGVAGLVLTDKTDSSKVLFFPAASYCFNGSVGDVDYGFYWSSSVGSSDVQYAHSLNFSSSEADWQNYDYRHYGFTVRGVLTEN